MCSQPCCGTGTQLYLQGTQLSSCLTQLAQDWQQIWSPQQGKKAAPALLPLVISWEKPAKAQSCHPSPAVLLLTFRLSLQTVKMIKEAEIGFKGHQNQNMISSEGHSLDFSWWERAEADGAAHPWAVPDVNSTLVSSWTSSPLFVAARQSSCRSLELSSREMLQQDELCWMHPSFPSGMVSAGPVLP